MAEYKVSNRYAGSLLQTSIDAKNLEQTSKDIELIVNALRENHKLQLMLSNPVIKPALKLSILNEIFKNKIGSQTIKFVKFIVDKGREDLLYSIFQKFLDLKDEYLGIVNVDVRTPFAFTSGQEEQLRKNLESRLNKKIIFKFSIDSNMIGGFIARVGDTVFDASVKHQLEILKKQFLEGGASLN
jgi:F-type H+-transporting ATPase subunit delta